tara:strand:- start:142 stop:399 length:258 start_codon:yes stop_codon:yes gene_type:complete
MNKNPDLSKKIYPHNSELKEIIVNYVGNALNPEDEEITTEQVIEVFAREFPEFLLCVAEENWINGYTQALKDTEFVEKQKNNEKS